MCIGVNRWIFWKTSPNLVLTKIQNFIEIQSSRFRWYSFVFARTQSRLVDYYYHWKALCTNKESLLYSLWIHYPYVSKCVEEAKNLPFPTLTNDIVANAESLMLMLMLSRWCRVPCNLYQRLIQMSYILVITPMKEQYEHENCQMTLTLHWHWTWLFGQLWFFEKCIICWRHVTRKRYVRHVPKWYMYIYLEHFGTSLMYLRLLVQKLWTIILF